MNNIFLFSFAVFTGALVSGLTGLGGGVILLAFMMPLFPPAVLIPLHGTIQLLSNISRSVIYFKGIRFRFVFPFAAGAAAGAISGIPFQLNLENNFHTIIIAVSILVLTWVPIVAIANDFRGKYFFLGGIEAFLSLFIGSTGPLTSPFFLSSKLDIRDFVPTKSTCQISVHLFKVIIYFLSGFSIIKWAGYILLSIPVIFIGTMASRVLAGKINEKLYRTIIKIVITILAVRMIVNFYF